MDELINQFAKTNTALANTLILYVMINAVIGILLGLFGRRISRFVLGLTGAFFGFTISIAFGASIIVAIGFAVVCFVLAILIQQIGTFFIGAIIGVVSSALIPDTNIPIMAGFALGGGMLALFLSDLFMIIATAFAGAMLTTNATFATFSLLSSNETGVISAETFLLHIIDVAVTFNSSQITLLVSTAYLYEIVALFFTFCLFQLSQLFRKPSEASYLTTHDAESHENETRANEIE
jgi:hypothetical protein